MAKVIEIDGCKEEWHHSVWHCPKCGTKTAWFCEGREDYYCGLLHLCTTCGSRFHLPNGAARVWLAYEKELAALGFVEPLPSEGQEANSSGG